MESRHRRLPAQRHGQSVLPKWMSNNAKRQVGKKFPGGPHPPQSNSPAGRKKFRPGIRRPVTLNPELYGRSRWSKKVPNRVSPNVGLLDLLPSARKIESSEVDTCQTATQRPTMAATDHRARSCPNRLAPREMRGNEVGSKPLPGPRSRVHDPCSQPDLRETQRRKVSTITTVHCCLGHQAPTCRKSKTHHADMRNVSFCQCHSTFPE